MAYGGGYGSSGSREQHERKKQLAKAANEAPRTLGAPKAGGLGTGASAIPDTTAALGSSGGTLPEPGKDVRLTVGAMDPGNPNAQLMGQQQQANAQHAAALAAPTGNAYSLVNNMDPNTQYAQQMGRQQAANEEAARLAAEQAAMTSSDKLGNIADELGEGYDWEAAKELAQSYYDRFGGQQLADQRARMGRHYGGAGALGMAQRLAADQSLSSAMGVEQVGQGAFGQNIRALGMAGGLYGDILDNENYNRWLDELPGFLDNPDDWPDQPVADNPAVYEGGAHLSDGGQDTIATGNSTAQVDAAFGQGGYDVLERDADGNPKQISLGAPGTVGGLIYTYDNGVWRKDDVARGLYNLNVLGWAAGAAKAAGSDSDSGFGGQKGASGGDTRTPAIKAADAMFGANNYDVGSDGVTVTSNGQTYRYNKSTGGFDPI